MSTNAVTIEQPTVRTVEATGPFEYCDSDVAEKAIVAVLVELPSGKTSRMTFCGHHFDRRPESLNKMIVATHDQRDFGLFADER